MASAWREQANKGNDKEQERASKGNDEEKEKLIMSTIERRHADDVHGMLDGF